MMRRQAYTALVVLGSRSRVPELVRVRDIVCPVGSPLTSAISGSLRMWYSVFPTTSCLLRLFRYDERATSRRALI